MSEIHENQTLSQPVDSPSDIHTLRTDASVPRLTPEGQVDQVRVEVRQVTGTVVHDISEALAEQGQKAQ